MVETYYVVYSTDKTMWEVRFNSKTGRLISEHRLKGRAKRKAQKLGRRYNRNIKVYNRAGRKVTDFFRYGGR